MSTAVTTIGAYNLLASPQASQGSVRPAATGAERPAIILSISDAAQSAADASSSEVTTYEGRLRDFLAGIFGFDQSQTFGMNAAALRLAVKMADHAGIPRPNDAAFNAFVDEKTSPGDLAVFDIADAVGRPTARVILDPNAVSANLWARTADPLNLKNQLTIAALAPVFSKQQEAALPFARQLSPNSAEYSPQGFVPASRFSLQDGNGQALGRIDFAVNKTSDASLAREIFGTFTTGLFTA